MAGNLRYKEGETRERRGGVITKTERDARATYFAQQKRTISRQGRTDHVSSTERIGTEKENGKCHVAGAANRVSAFTAMAGRTRDKRARVYTHVYVRGKSGRGIEVRSTSGK